MLSGPQTLDSIQQDTPTTIETNNPMATLGVTGTGDDYSLTINTGGTYEIKYTTLVNITGGGEISVSIQNSGTAQAGLTQTITAPSGQDIIVSNSVIANLTGGDQLTLAIAGSNISGSVKEASFTVKKLD